MTYLKIVLSISLFILISVGFSQTKKVATTDTYSKEMMALAQKKSVKEAFAVIDNLESATRKVHIELTEIPAPPFKESIRALRFKQLLEAAGPDKVWIDSLGNVLAMRKGKKDGRTVVLDAHLDTVFPEGTDVKVKIKGDTLFAPGISDDTRGLVSLLTVLHALEKANIETNDDVLFVASLGEEGLGDLRGVKYVIARSNIKIDSWISIDGTEIGRIGNAGLGSIRYKIMYKGPGGHSWGAFGMGNPHHAMAKGMNYFSDEAMRFTSTGIRTSFNVGRTGGGTSVNSIPFESWAEVDLRSESPERLNKIDSIMKSTFRKGLDEYNRSIKKGPALTLTIDQIGFRPSGTTAENQPLVQRSMAAARYFGTSPILEIVATNGNIPISKGIPAITIGAGGKSSNHHALSEWWINDKGADGIKLALLILLAEAGVAGDK